MDVRDLPAEVLITCALTVIAAVIRLIVINNQSFWWDEALTAYEVHLPFGAMVHTVLHVETSPPLYFVLMWAWAHVFGTGEIALRSVSTIAGIALVPIAYLCAEEAFSRRAGVAAAAFVAVNPFMIWYSQEARTYMLFAALSAAAFLYFLRARRDPSVRNLAWWTVFSSIAVMTHFFAGFAAAPEALWLLWKVRSRLVAGSVAIVAVVQVAMLPFAGSDTTHGVGWIAAIPLYRRIGRLFSDWGLSSLNRQVSIAAALVVGGALIMIVAWLLRRGASDRSLGGVTASAWVTAFAILVPLFLALVGQDYFLSRNVIPAFIPATVLVAAACVAPRTRVIGAALASALLVMFAIATVKVQTQATLERPNWRALAHAVGPARVPRMVLYAGGDYADPLKLYLPHVAWVQPTNRTYRIQEVDLVGAPWFLPPIRGHDRKLLGRPQDLLGHGLSSGAAFDRFALPPTRTTIRRLIRLSLHLFRRRPRALFFFFEGPGG